jgi:small-conductance mechanosensitive channel
MLLGMLLSWIIHDDRRRLPSMNDGQTIAYISDVGAFRLKPLFIAGSCVTTVFLDLSFLAERWLRHNGRLVPNGSVFQKVLAVLSLLFAIVGTAGLILLSIFDTYHHDKAHDIFLLLFIGGYLLSAVFICWEYQRLGIGNREHRILGISFWIKLVFILVELCLAIVFASTSFTDNYNVAAVFEWVVAFIFTLYVFSFVIDLWPAIRTKHHTARFVKPTASDMEEANENSANGYQGYGNGSAYYHQNAGVAPAAAMQQQPPPPPPVQTTHASNF